MGQCVVIKTAQTCNVRQMTATHADWSSCFSCSLRSELRQLVGAPPTAPAQVHLHRLITTGAAFEVSLDMELILFLGDIYTGNNIWMSCLFVLHAASSLTKDCLQLLKLLGVPVIQVRPAKHGLCIFVHISPTYSFLPSLTSCIYIFISLFFFLSYAPGSRGCWGTVRPSGERGDCGRCGIRGHGHTAVWSQYSHSPAECQEGQVRTAQFMCCINNCTGVFSCFNNFPNYTIDIYVGRHGFPSCQCTMKIF